MGGFNLPFLGGDHDPRSVCSLYRLEKERESVCLYSPPKAQLADTVVLVQLKELGWTSARQDWRQETVVFGRLFIYCKLIWQQMGGGTHLNSTSSKPLLLFFTQNLFYQGYKSSVNCPLMTFCFLFKYLQVLCTIHDQIMEAFSVILKYQLAFNFILNISANLLWIFRRWTRTQEVCFSVHNIDFEEFNLNTKY